MNISTDPVDWDKPIFWVQINDGMSWPATLVSKNCLEPKEEIKSKADRRSTSVYCIFVKYNDSHDYDGAVRWVDEKGAFDNKNRVVFNEAEDVKVTQVVKVFEKLDENEIPELGTL